MLNQIVLVGRLTRDIQVRKSDKGTKFATISLAIPRSLKIWRELMIQILLIVLRLKI